MTALTIQFDGICCHIKPPNGTPQDVKRRSVLPDVPGHVTYIEVYATDLDEAVAQQFQFTSPYKRNNRVYQRLEVKDVKIELLNVTSGPLEELASFKERIPKLSDVEPRFTALKPHLLAQAIPSGKVAAYFDIQAGMLLAGPPEGFRTAFDPPKNWPIRHLGQWVQLEVEVSAATPQLRISSLNGGGVRTVTLREGASLITIGNQPRSDILGGPQVSSSSNHFPHYYELSEQPLTGKLPTPKQNQGLGAGCGDTQWP